MAWSEAQDERDQDAQWAWVESWHAWDTIPEWVSDLGGGWNALHGQAGGFGQDPELSNVPTRFWDNSWNPATGRWA